MVCKRNTGTDFLGAFAKLRKATISFMSVRPSAWNSVHIRWIFTKFGIWALFEILSRKFRCHHNLTIITGFLHEALYTFMIISRSIILRMRNISYKLVEKMKTHIVCSITFFFRKSCLLWHNVGICGTAKQATNDNTTWLCMLDNWKPETHTQNMQHLSFFHGNTGYVNAPHYYVICILPVLAWRTSICTCLYPSTSITHSHFIHLPQTLCNCNIWQRR